MTSCLLCCAVLSAPPGVDSVFRSDSNSPPVFRAQSADPFADAATGFQPQYGPPPTYSPPTQAPSIFGDAFGGPQPIGDPFIEGQPLPVQAVGGTVFPFRYFTVGPQRPGWEYDASYGIMPNEGLSISPGFGSMGIQEFDLSARYRSTGGFWDWSVAPQYSARWWEGPSGGFGLASDVHHFAVDFEASTPRGSGPWGAVIGFTPSINTDFETNLKSDAYNWDGRFYLTYDARPGVTLVGGFGYWDRVTDRFIPYAGAIIAPPNSRWEFHLTVPEGKVTYFLGNSGSYASWLYARAEYHVEAYQVETGSGIAPRANDKVELQDYRILLGYAASNGRVDAFAEAGWVLGREVNFARGTVPDYGIDDGFIGRVGIRF